MEKKNTPLIILSIFIFLIIIFSATYAYFQAQRDTDASAEINVTTETTDSLSFNTTDAISIMPTMTSFASGTGNQNGETKATATLRANSKTHEAVANYYVYLKITKNEFTYSTPDKKPELILTITDPDGKVLGEDSPYKINGYDFKNVTTNVNESDSQEVKGYDVTEAHGLLTIAYDKEIDVTVTDEPNGEKSEEWKVILTLINLDSDQQINTGKHFNGELLIQKEEIDVTIADEAIPNEPLTQAVINLWNNLSYEESKIIKHDGSDANDANDQSYRYTGGDYALTSLALEKEYQSINDIIKLTCGDVASEIANDYCASGAKYTLDYNDDLQEEFTTLKAVLTKAIEDGYISDNNVKNYVCFGEECTSNKDNLYRIIGAFQVEEEYQIKLVKADIAGKEQLGEEGNYAIRDSTAYNTYLGNHNEWPRYKWDANGTNSWSESALNKENLNTFYLNKLGDYADKIAMMQWQVGGMTYPLGHEQGAHTAYINELGDSKTISSYSAQIGLMYVSDYYYGATKDRWILPGFVSDGNDYRKAAWDNWTWIGDDFWFITPSTSASTHAFLVSTYGHVHTFSSADDSRAARPTFYLNGNVKYVSGTGTESDPIIIN